MLRFIMASANLEPQPRSSRSRRARVATPIRSHMYFISADPVSAGDPIARMAGLLRLNFSGTTSTRYLLYWLDWAFHACVVVRSHSPPYLAFSHFSTVIRTPGHGVVFGVCQT